VYVLPRVVVVVEDRETVGKRLGASICKGQMRYWGNTVGVGGLEKFVCLIEKGLGYATLFLPRMIWVQICGQKCRPSYVFGGGKVKE